MRTIFVLAIIYLLKFIRYAILARVILSYLPMTRENQLVRLLYQFTEPILAPFRKLMERSTLAKGSYMFDFAPILAFILIGLLEYVFGRLLLPVTGVMPARF